MIVMRWVPLRSVMFGMMLLPLQQGVFAQTNKTATTPPSTQPADQSLPKDPGEILSLAGQANGLGSPGLAPWHVKASYETFDAQGKSSGHGTFEVFWDGPKKYRQTITSDAFSQTQYATESGIYRTGNLTPLPYPQAYLIDQLLHPMPNQEDIAEANPERREHDPGNVKLQCVMLSQKIVGVAYAPLGLFPTYCFSTEKPILRYSTFGGVNTIFNHLVLFQGRYLAKQITITDENVPTFSIQVDEIGGLGTVDNAIFTPPADAVNTHDTIPEVPAGVIAGNILTKVPPIYPEKAKYNRTTGTVLFQAVIGRDGRIHRLKILESPDPSLTVAAFAAVQRWVYKPYLLNGEPVEVTTKITVHFAIG
jgi:TonB family protein